MIAGLPFRALPLRTREAVCILTEGQDHWGVAYSAFILAKQAGFELEFQHASQPLRDASFYLLPSVEGYQFIARRRLLELLARVKAGATLYVSLGSGLPDGFEALTGLEPQTRERGRPPGEITFEGIAGLSVLPDRGEYKVSYRATRATVLGRAADGNPAFTVAQYGRGRVYFLTIPLEMTLTRTPGAFHSESAPPAWRIYRHMLGRLLNRRAARKTHPLVALTEHRLDANARVEIVINQSPHPIRETLAVQPGWRLQRVLYGQAETDGRSIIVPLRKNAACVAVLARGRRRLAAE
jgi:hypothetical protein